MGWNAGFVRVTQNWWWMMLKCAQFAQTSSSHQRSSHVRMVNFGDGLAQGFPPRYTVVIYFLSLIFWR
ncbi:hypothetical protein BJY01DRAFT_204664 [Aspergillus pseudoustus]|uniref:Secreted protein n=1 Tax=Aspergillus pseudoustus TaxID=1810923 RepID=A0ABR4KT34_9EURO